MLARRPHLLLRAPREDEEQLLRALGRASAGAAPAGGVEVLASRPPAASVRALLLRGELSAWTALLERLAAAPPPGGELAAALDNALFPPLPDRWPLRTRTLELDRPLVMGIVNATPDSFSDGGLSFDAALAIERGRLLAEAGADLLDVGGESTRPGAERVSEEEELRRILPVVAELAQGEVPVSVDTTRSGVARQALERGAEIVNDVSAFSFDPELAHVVAESGAGAVLMHMRGTPLTMQQDPVYQDVMGELLDFLGAALERAREAGVDLERCAVDPGIGFGKRLVDNEEILYRLEELRPLGRPVLVGPSRKGFLDPQKRHAPAERLPETLAAACLAAVEGAHILRVHDVAECSRALEIVRRIHFHSHGVSE